MASDKIDNALSGIPLQYRGPGGAAAVVQDGRLVGQRIWGFADLDQQIPMTADTLLPICSISKQMFCALVLDLQQNPAPAMASKDGDAKQQLQRALEELLPADMVKRTGLTIDHLCNNHSGVRDYWALTTLWGARPEDAYSIAEHSSLTLERLKSLHFAPGTEFSYCNTNFHILGRAIERVTEQSLEDLLVQRIFGPAGMQTARLAADSAKLPPPCVGYEGTETHGYRAAVNRIEWAGDAGIVASLKDMIAYEAFLDDSLTNKPQSWYAEAISSPTYADGSPANYKYGLFHALVHGIKIIGHGGALRGFRLQRLHIPEKRLSVVVLFNHEAGAAVAAEAIAKEVLGAPAAPKPAVAIEPSPEWIGAFFDKETQLLVEVSATDKKSELSISYAVSPGAVVIKEPKRAEAFTMKASIDGDLLTIERLIDNRTLKATRIKSPATGAPAIDAAPFNGRFYCEDIDSTFHCTNQGGLLYAAFDGYHGKGPMQPMRYVGESVWALSCPRGMDAPAPGTWTLVFSQDEDGSVSSVTIGCWLARKLEYKRVQ